MSILYTRNNLDGVVCGLILTSCLFVDSVKLCSESDADFVATTDDVIAGLPYQDGVKMWFDHIEPCKEVLDVLVKKDNWEINSSAKSTARVIYDYCRDADMDTRLIPHDIIEVLEEDENMSVSIDIETEGELVPDVSLIKTVLEGVSF